MVAIFNYFDFAYYGAFLLSFIYLRRFPIFLIALLVAALAIVVATFCGSHAIFSEGQIRGLLLADNFLIWVLSLFLLLSRAILDKQPFSSQAFKIICFQVVLLSLIPISSVLLDLGILVHRVTLDPLLLQMDCTWGVAPSVWLWQATKTMPLVYQGMTIIYLSLPLAFFVVAAHHFFCHGKLPWELLVQYLFLGIVGYLVYNFFPATGPKYAYPDWPHLTYVVLQQKMAVLNMLAPRNAMPSLHIAWLVLIASYVLKQQIYFRVSMCVWLLLIALGTLTTGEHYLIDLLMGLFFAITAQALWLIFFTPQKKESYLILFSALGVYMIWMKMIMFAVPYLAVHSFVNLLAWGLSLCFGIFLERRLLK